MKVSCDHAFFNGGSGNGDSCQSGSIVVVIIIVVVVAAAADAALAVEGRRGVCCYVATADIPGAFLQTQADSNNEIIIRLDWQLARTLLKINRELYKPAIEY